MTFSVYILRCTDDSFYVGQTSNLDERIRQHSDRAACVTTMERPANELVWVEEFESREDALRRERQLKGWTRAKKEALIRGDLGALKVLARSVSSPSTPLRDEVGTPLRDEVGTPLRDEVGTPLRDEVGTPLGDEVGTPLGDEVGTPLGDEVGTPQQLSPERSRRAGSGP